MIEIYLRLIDRILTPILFLLAIVLLLRGHDLPGGGFIAALVAASAISVQILSRGSDAVRHRIGRFLQPMMGFGLLLAVCSALVGIAYGQGFFKGIWWEIHLGPIDYKIGTPVIFDFGVFFTVVGVTSSYLLGLSEGIIEARGQTAPASNQQQHETKGESA